jgi:hypothetical protein
MKKRSLVWLALFVGAALFVASMSAFASSTMSAAHNGQIISAAACGVHNAPSQSFHHGNYLLVKGPRDRRHEPEHHGHAAPPPKREPPRGHAAPPPKQEPPRGHAAPPPKEEHHAAPQPKQEHHEQDKVVIKTPLGTLKIH